jgi:hypothetical protein
MAKSSKFARFDKASTETRLRIIANSTGEVGTGKSEFWLGAPAPIVFLSMDQGLEGVVEPFAREKEIYVATYNLGLTPKEEGDDSPTELDQDTAIEVRNKYVLDFEAAIRDGAKTIVQDRETDFWYLCSFAEFGDPRTGTPKNWDALKSVQRRLIAMVKETDINLGIIQGMKNEWVSQINKKTGAKGITQSGERVPAGHDDVDALVHINLMHTRTNGKFEIHVGKSRGPGSGDLQDQTLPAMSFSDFAQLVFPESNESDWV